MDLKQAALSTCTIVFVLSSMLGMGLGLRVSEIVAPLRNWRLVLLMVITVGYIPIVLPALLPGTSVNPAQIARSLVLLMLLPLGGALAVNAYRPRLAARVKPPLDQIANISLIALIALQTLLNLRSVAAVFGTFGILAAVVFLAAGYATGWVLGGPARDTRVVLGLGTAQRNIAASLVVASQSFDDPTVVVMVVVVAVAGSLMLVPLARMLATRATRIVSPNG